MAKNGNKKGHDKGGWVSGRGKELHEGIFNNLLAKLIMQKNTSKQQTAN